MKLQYRDGLALAALLAATQACNSSHGSGGGFAGATAATTSRTTPGATTAPGSTSAPGSTTAPPGSSGPGGGTVVANGQYVVEVTAPSVPVKNVVAGTTLGQVHSKQRFVVHAEKSGSVGVDWQGREGWIETGKTTRVTGDAVVVQKVAAVTSAAKTTAPVLGKAQAGQAYALLGSVSGWVEVQFDDRAGWIEAANVAKIAFATAPAPKPPSGATPATPATPAGTMPAFATKLLAERSGFGAKTTGGDPINHLYHVTTLADSGPGSFRTGIESADPNWIVFDVSGTIALAKDIQIKFGNKTIDGRGKKVTIVGGLKMTSISNVIMTDFAIQNPRGDAIGIRGNGTVDPALFDAKNFWFHHLELFTSDDGLIDVRGGTDITIDWCHEHTHLKAHLLADNTVGKPTPGMRLTVHHNYFERITRRGVNLVYGICDYYNNYQYRWYEWGNASYDGALMLSEANIYEARPGIVTFERDPNPGGDYDWLVSKKGLITTLSTYTPGYTKSVNDVTVNGADLTVNQPGKVFDRAKYYTAQIDKPDKTLQNRIVNEAGPR